MSDKQKTLKQKISFSGVGLHTGTYVTITLCPAPVNHWYAFRRVDLPNKPLIPAEVQYVVDTARGTVLEKDGARVHTTEHLLAALVGLDLDNVLIEIDGPEVPILDGSSAKFCEGILEAGIEEQNANKNYFVIEESVDYSTNDRQIELAALPFDKYSLTVMVDYNSKVIPSQHARLHDIENFKDKIAPCRTFVFMHEIEALFKAGLIKGGDLNNAIVISETDITPEKAAELAQLLNKEIATAPAGIVNTEQLKFTNEPARHKLLDLMGDLALVGRPLKAHILAARPGHAANVQLAKAIRNHIDKQSTLAPTFDQNQDPVLSVTDIARLLPHRYPYQLVDKVVSLDGTSVIGVKNVTMNEPQFTGHFPDNPVFPGVMQVEAIAQTGGVLVLTATGNPELYWPYLVSIDNCRFFRNVLPGDSLVMRCNLLSPIRLGVAKMHGEAWVGKNLVCSVDMTARLVKKS